MKAIILSSGKGTRMMPLTKDIPKPMLKIGNEYLLENKIKLLEDSGLNEIYINVAYKKKIIMDYTRSLNKNIQIVDEGDEPLGTAAGIRNITKNFSDEEIIVINSDVWTDFNISKLCKTKLDDNLAQIVLIKTPNYLPGDFNIEGNKIKVGSDYVFSGIGKYHTRLFQKYDYRELGDILRAEQKISFTIYNGQWIDIGTPERLKKAKQEA